MYNSIILFNWSNKFGKVAWKKKYIFMLPVLKNDRSTNDQHHAPKRSFIGLYMIQYDQGTKMIWFWWFGRSNFTSGFHFRSQNVVITHFLSVEPVCDSLSDIALLSSSGGCILESRSPLALSSPNNHDFFNQLKFSTFF